MITSTCPYLGLKEDPATALNFSSEGNYCHKVNPAVPIHRQHQMDYCLVAEHVRCPVFVKDEKALLPVDAVSSTHRMILVGRMFWGVLVPVMLILIGTVAAAWWLSRDKTADVGMAAQLKNIRKGSLLTLQETPSTLPITGGAPTITPFQPVTGGTGGSTPAACGPPAGWVVYTVQPTDSIFLLSLVYGVSVEDLQRANCLGENTIVRPGDQFYVPRPATPTPTVTPTPTRRPPVIIAPPTATRPPSGPVNPPAQPTATRAPTQPPPTATQPVVIPPTPTPPPPPTPTTPAEPPTDPPPTQPLPPTEPPTQPTTPPPSGGNPTLNPWDLLRTLVPTVLPGG